MAFFDPGTLDVYEINAQAYAARSVSKNNWNSLRFFSAKLPQGACVLDLGCGSGWAAEDMQKRGFDVHALDASPSLAAMASRKIARPAMQKRFDEIEQVDQFDGVFACNALPHVPKRGIAHVLNKIARSMRENGVLYACFASGSGEMQDSIGRYYALYEPDELLSMFEQQPSLQFSSMRTESGTDEFGAPQILFGILARKKSNRVN